MPVAATHVPPQNIEAEESVLGAILVSKAALARVVDDVQLLTDDFYLDRHRLIFETACALRTEGAAVDSITVAAALDKRSVPGPGNRPIKALEAAGGKRYVSELEAKVPAVGNAKTYAGIVKEKAACDG